MKRNFFKWISWWNPDPSYDPDRDRDPEKKFWK